MILCTFCAIAIFSSAQGKFSIRGNAGEKWNNQLLYLCLMDDGEKAKEVILDSEKVKKGKFSFSGVRQTPNIALIKDRDGGILRCCRHSRIEIFLIRGKCFRTL